MPAPLCHSRPLSVIPAVLSGNPAFFLSITRLGGTQHPRPSQGDTEARRPFPWIPAFAGMTGGGGKDE